MAHEAITWDSEKGPSEEQVDDAMRVLRADYWRSIRSMAQDVASRVRSGEVKRDEVGDAVHDTADGSFWVIYTHANYRAIICSDADPWSLAEDAGFEAPTLPHLAYLVVERDLTEQVEAELSGDDSEVQS